MFDIVAENVLCHTYTGTLFWSWEGRTAVVHGCMACVTA